MSFKDLKDRVRVRALPHFLDAARDVPALLLTVVVQKSLGSLFETRPDGRENSELSELVDALTPITQERLSRILHFLALLVAGVSSPGQDLTWVSDEDSIAANQARLAGLARLAGNLISHYLTHDLRHFQVTTTAYDDGSMMAEDLTSICDLAAGASAEALTKEDGASVPVGEIALLSKELSHKAVYLLGELGRSDSRLRHLCVHLHGDSKTIKIEPRQFFWVARQ